MAGSLGKESQPQRGPWLEEPTDLDMASFLGTACWVPVEGRDQFSPADVTDTCSPGCDPQLAQCSTPPWDFQVFRSGPLSHLPRPTYPPQSLTFSCTCWQSWGSEEWSDGVGHFFGSGLKPAI